MQPQLNASIYSIIEQLYKLRKPTDQAIALQKLNLQYTACMKCPLATLGRSQVVFGSGRATASIMIIGEAPGRDEDAQGSPFVGRSGQLLTTLLKRAGIERSEIYISNIAKCRPPENRPPTLEESNICSSLLLLQEIAIIRPRVICTLGATATKAFITSKQTISMLRGQLITTDYFTVLPTYHPSYVLRNRAAGDTVVADLLQINNWGG